MTIEKRMKQNSFSRAAKIPVRTLPPVLAGIRAGK
jgi:hypothetical protein